MANVDAFQTREPPSTWPGAVEIVGFGLPGMRERVQRLGGRLSIDTSPGAGTRVSVGVPR